MVEGFPFKVAVAEPMGSHILLTGTVWDTKVRVVAPPRMPAGWAPTCRLGSIPPAPSG